MSGASTTRSRPDKFATADAAAAAIRDGATVGLVGGGGGLLEADHVFAAIERRFLATGHPRDLTVVHALGIGDRDRRGMNRFAHEGLVRRVIGGHWVWSPRMQALAREERIEAYVLPGGVVGQLFREIAAGRPGLITRVGLGTFVDPRIEGGRMNHRASDDLSEVIEIGGRTYLRYLPFPIDIAIVRGSFADGAGNVSLDQEAANLDIAALAMAARNSGGCVIAQVRTAVARDTLPARAVRIPGAMVDVVVVDPDQPMSHAIDYDPTISGERRGPPVDDPAPAISVREVIARRAAAELFPGAVINFGFGMPDAVARLISRRGERGLYDQTIEHGTYGGDLLDGVHFGFARNPSAMIDAPSQFDFYGGGGLDIAFLGFGEVDAAGNVNASKFAGTPVGPGGFIDIAQTARKVVFCGTFEAKGGEVATGDGQVTVRRAGEVQKFVGAAEQITFAGAEAIAAGQTILYVTERAVFRLTQDGVALAEVAPGVDIRRDIVDRMGFAPLIPTAPQMMPASIFRAADTAVAGAPDGSER